MDPVPMTSTAAHQELPTELGRMQERSCGGLWVHPAEEMAGAIGTAVSLMAEADWDCGRGGTDLCPSSAHAAHSTDPAKRSGTGPLSSRTLGWRLPGNERHEAEPAV